ncbi:MAG: GDSL-type esterase/lipase family protein [Patescibacteria group bacterium]|nr:GDSL-type esterase/lipase family protein [Patescibacteria group bacterium]
MSKRICVFGDSIAWGANDFDSGGWVDKFKVYFFKTGQFNEVFNLANPGDNTSMLLKRMENECASRMKLENKNVNVVIIQIGINDSLSYKNSKKHTNINDFKKNLIKLLIIIKKFTNKIVFIGLTKVKQSKTNPFCGNETGKCYNNKNIEKYDLAIKDFCEKNSLPFIEMFDLLNDEDLEDGLHPNSEGHKKMFIRVRDFLIKNKII